MLGTIEAGNDYNICVISFISISPLASEKGGRGKGGRRSGGERRGATEAVQEEEGRLRRRKEESK